MNLLDENTAEPQVRLLRARRVAFRLIGVDIGHKGMSDREIIALIHGLPNPTLFTLDADFYRRSLCHARYCLVHLDVESDQMAHWCWQLLRHRDFNTRAKRMGNVIPVTPTRISVIRQSSRTPIIVKW